MKLKLYDSAHQAESNGIEITVLITLNRIMFDLYIKGSLYLLFLIYFLPISILWKSNIKLSY